MGPETHTFPNGFRIVYEKSKSKLPITTVYLFCDLGSLYEKENVRGVSHFIEHMCFKGTHTILQAKDIFKEFDRSGSRFNASTYKQYTCYYLECLSEKLSKYMHILSDILLHSTFVKKEFDKEYRVVVEENVKNKDEKEYILEDEMNRLVYKGCPLENPIDSLSYHKGRPFDYETVVKLYKLFYQPHNMVLSIVSNLSFSTLLSKIRNTYFYTRKNEVSEGLSNEKLVLYKPPVMQTDIQYKIEKIANSNATYLSIAFRTCSQQSIDKYVLNLLQFILGEFYNSRLFLLLRDENGLTYKTKAVTQYYEVMGDLTLMAITDPQKLMVHQGTKKGVYPLIIDMLRKLRKTGVTSEELSIAKEFIQGRMILRQDNQDTNAIYNGEQILFYHKKQILPYDKIYETYYRDVTLSQMNDVIRRYIKRENMSVCILGEWTCSPKLLRKETEKLFAS